MKELFSLGELYVSDFLKDGESPRHPPVEMKMMLDEDTGLVRLEKSAPLNTMYADKYWYRSGINWTMKQELSDIVDSITKIKPLKEDDVWVDIACNDGTLLSFLPKNVFRIGIDPVDDSYKRESELHADLIIQDYFSAEVFKKSKYGQLKADVVTTIAMFYDLEHPIPFINDVKEILAADGIWVLQMSYTPLMIQQLAFDNICHEHMYYYSLFNIENMLNECGMEVVDVHLNDINGGSFRIWVMKKGSEHLLGSQPHRDVCRFRVQSLLEYEYDLDLDYESTWEDFYDEINKLKNQTVSFIKEEVSKGKTVYAYGASTKGNTLLQYFELDNTLITAIAERSPYKYGLRTVGTNIPIVCEDAMRKANPDYLLVLPWHFINEFVKREETYLNNGGKFIVPCPKFEVIGSHS